MFLGLKKLTFFSSSIMISLLSSGQELSRLRGNVLFQYVKLCVCICVHMLVYTLNGTTKTYTYKLYMHIQSHTFRQCVMDRESTLLFNIEVAFFWLLCFKKSIWLISNILPCKGIFQFYFFLLFFIERYFSDDPCLNNIQFFSCIS